MFRNLCFFMFFAGMAFADVVAVLEITPSGNNVKLSVSEFRYLTDELRAKAREALPQSNYSILTRDNIIQLLPPDEKEAECLAESCAVDIGRAIGAEYVAQGFVGNFAGMLTLTVELYESMNGNMLGSFLTESENVKGLLDAIREKAPDLFAKLPMTEHKKQSKAQAPPAVGKSSAAKESNAPFFVAISLDVLSAAVLGFGIYQHTNANKHYNEHVKLSNGLLPEDEHGKAKKELREAQSARKSRDAALIIGSTLLASGIMVHIFF